MVWVKKKDKYREKTIFLISRIFLCMINLVALYCVWANYQFIKGNFSVDENEVAMWHNSYGIVEKKAISVRVRERSTLFIVINCKNPSIVPLWLKDCKLPLCRYEVFGDEATNTTNISNTTSTSVYQSPFRNSGYRNFGYRGRFQMQRALDHNDFDWLVKVDEDGYLCIDSLLHILRSEHAPKEKFFFGRFHCRRECTRADENFLVMSYDVVRYFLKTWEMGLVKFDGRITLGLNIGSQLAYLHNKCGWTYWSDQKRLRWDEPLSRHHSCNTHIWFHHLSNRENKMMRYRHVVTHPFNASTSFSSFDKDKKTKKLVTSSVNHTGCAGWRRGGLITMKNMNKISFREGATKAETDFRKRSLFKKSKLIEVDFSKIIPPCRIKLD